MQDKIQEIMGLVQRFGEAARDAARKDIHGTMEEWLKADDLQCSAYAAIESKLLELLEREPLSLERIYEIEAVSNVPHTRTTYTKDCWGDDKKETEEIRVFSFPLFARNIELAHNITNTSGVE